MSCTAFWKKLELIDVGLLEIDTCNFCQIIDAVVAARILNATLVVPKLDQRSYWKDARLVFVLLINLILLEWISGTFLKEFILICCIMSYACSNFEDIFDIDWFISFLSNDVNVLKELPSGPKVTTMRVPRKCNERCYEKRVLPVIMKRHVSLQHISQIYYLNVISFWESARQAHTFLFFSLFKNTCFFKIK